MSTRTCEIANLENEIVLSELESEDKEHMHPPPKTPKRRHAEHMPEQTLHFTILQDALQTPRRSNRKSIKPIKEYNEIISSTRKLRSTVKGNSNDQVGGAEGDVFESRWTPAKVGRVSQRRGRKVRRDQKTQKKLDLDENGHEVKDILAGVVDEDDEQAYLQMDEINKECLKDVMSSKDDASAEEEKVIQRKVVENKIEKIEVALEELLVEEVEHRKDGEVDLRTKESNEEIEESNSYITKRRKHRSLSFDESLLICTSTKNKTEGTTPKKIAQTPQKPRLQRTKLPNFAAIHQKHFSKMENLVDHVQRKAERAKLLTSSAVKTVTASTQKSASSTKIHEKQNYKTTAAADKPKALKKINLGDDVKLIDEAKKLKDINGIEMEILRRLPGSYLAVNNVNIDDDAKSMDDFKKLPGLSSIMDINTDEMERLRRLPNPKLALIKPIQARGGGRVGVSKTATYKGHANMPKAINNKVSQPTPTKKPCKPVAQQHQHPQGLRKPAFNLSTIIENKPNAMKVFALNASIASATVATVADAATETTATSASGKNTLANKSSIRRQRHIEMFKGRSANSSIATTTSASARNLNVIRGVRSNRRFELQMQHRRNITEH